MAYLFNLEVNKLIFIAMYDGLDSTFTFFNEDLSVEENKIFSHLYNTHSKQLKRFVQRYVHSETIAEDIVQDLFVKIWNNRAQLSHIEALEAYLFRMAKNASLDCLKKIKRIELMPDEMIREFKNYHQGIEALAHEKEYFVFLKQQLAKLPETSQKVFYMCRQEGKSYEEVSKELNISKNTVKHHMVATVKKLKKNVLEKLRIHNNLKIVLFIFMDRFLP